MKRKECRLLYFVVLMLLNVSAYSQDFNKQCMVLHHEGGQTLIPGGCVDDAISKAVDGDSIFLSWGVFDGFTLDKNVTIIAYNTDMVRISSDININLSDGISLDAPLLQGFACNGTINVNCHVNNLSFYNVSYSGLNSLSEVEIKEPGTIKTCVNNIIYNNVWWNKSLDKYSLFIQDLGYSKIKIWWDYDEDKALVFPSSAWSDFHLYTDGVDFPEGIHTMFVRGYYVGERYQEGWTTIQTIKYEKPFKPEISVTDNLLTITSPNVSAQIYCSLDGTIPTDESMEMPSNGIMLTEDCKVTARAWPKNRMNLISTVCYLYSDIVSADVKIKRPCATPQFEMQDDKLLITCSTPGATVYYTVDGTDPTVESNVCPAEGISLSHNCTVKAMAVKEGWFNSEIGAYSVRSFFVSKPKATVDNLFIHLTCDTPDATIHYSLDGTNPLAGYVYTEPIAITGDIHLTAVAVKDGFTNSENLYFDALKSTFTCTPVEIDASDGLLVLSCLTDGAEIHYTIDGVTPTESSPLYQGPVEIAGNCTVKAIALKQGMFSSEVTTYEVNTFVVRTPKIDIENLKVVLSCATPGAAIYYTLDGSDPVSDGRMYSSPIDFTGDMVIKFVAIKEGYITSETVSQTLSYAAWTCSSADIFSEELVDGSGMIVTMTTRTEGAEIHYTLDGSVPTAASPLYTDGVKVSSNCTVKAIVVKQNMFDSGITDFVISSFVAATPTMEISDLKIVLTSTTPNTQIYYTLDGSSPLTNGTKYTQPLPFSEDMTISFCAMGDGYNPSEIVTQNLTVASWTCATPDIRLVPSTDGKMLQLVLTSQTENAILYYTIDGSNPSLESSARKVYSGNNETIEHNCVLKAVAIRSDMFPSAISQSEIVSFVVEKPTIKIENLKVKLECATEGATIYYTIDGSNPDIYGVAYSKAFDLDDNVKVMACAKKSGYTTSPILEQTVTLESLTCSAPIITLSLSQEDNVMLLMITTRTENATIYYTTDGSDPSVSSTRQQYSSVATLTSNCIVKAIVEKENMFASEVVQEKAFFVRAAKPIFTFHDGMLSLKSSTEGAVIYYEIGGKEPDRSSNVYVSDILLVDNKVVKAIAYSDSYLESSVAEYTPDYFKCEAVTVDYDGHSFTLADATEGATIYYTIDGSRPNAESSVYDGSRVMLEGITTVRAIAMKDDFITSNEITYVTPAFFDGYRANVSEPGQLSRAFNWCDRMNVAQLEVYGNMNAVDFATVRTMMSLRHLDLSGVVVVDKSIPDRAFADMHLISLSTPADIVQVGKSILDGVTTLGAVEWNISSEVPVDMLGDMSLPNMLLYVNAEGYADRTVYKNVIVNGEAEDISLVDASERGNFYCPKSFSAKRITYVHSFGMPTVVDGGCQGWEAISLPFDVERIVHPENKECVPFAAYDLSSEAKPFWLCSLTSNGFRKASSIKANKPYIICMPNNESYGDQYILAGQVTFSATNTEISETIVQPIEYDDYLFVANFEYLNPNDSVISLNIYDEDYEGYNMGSVFVPNRREAKPFEPYFKMKEGILQASAPLRINDNTTEIMHAIISSHTDFYVENGALYVHSNGNSTLKIYSADGILYRILELHDGWNRADGIARGLYLIRGKKILIE